MTDIHQVFARFRDESPEPSPQREVLSIRRRGGGLGTRAVEVVHIRSSRSSLKDQPGRPTNIRAAAWSDGFPAKQAPATTPVEAPEPQKPAQPTVHVMPVWQPSDASSDAPDEVVAAPRKRGRPRKDTVPATAVSADPFNDQDEGANCLRCGYRVQDARASRGLLTCADCG